MHDAAPTTTADHLVTFDDLVDLADRHGWGSRTTTNSLAREFWHDQHDGLTVAVWRSRARRVYLVRVWWDEKPIAEWSGRAAAARAAVIFREPHFAPARPAREPGSSETAARPLREQLTDTDVTPAYVRAETHLISALHAVIVAAWVWDRAASGPLTEALNDTLREVRALRPAQAGQRLLDGLELLQGRPALVALVSAQVPHLAECVGVWRTLVTDHD